MTLGGLLAADPGKRAVERWWLIYTPVWGAISAVVMVGGLADLWGDIPCMLYGLVLFLGAVVPPIVRRPVEDRDGPWWRSTAAKMGLSITLLSFGLNYTQTPYFFDVLHMHYGFLTTWNLDRNPLFLYLVSVAYFSTYATLCLMAFRAIAGDGTSRARRGFAFVLAPMAMAFLETALNANPFIARLFCYDDLPLMLGFGTLSYGVAFVFALPVWLAIDERPGTRLPIAHVAIGIAAALYADTLTLDALRYGVAPHLTTVVTDAPGLRDHEESCLEAPVGRVGGGPLSAPSGPR